MTKRKPVYIIEIRRRLNKNENKSIGWTFGAFSSVKRAHEYVVENGSQLIRDYAKGHAKSRLFFAILELRVDDPDWPTPLAEVALDLSGKETYWFN
jgi:hypothetical protein